MPFNIAYISLDKKEKYKTLKQKSDFPGDKPIDVGFIFPREMAEYFGIPSNRITKYSGEEFERLNQLRRYYKYKLYIETAKENSNGSLITFTCGYSHKLPQKKIKEWILNTWKNQNLLSTTIIKLQNGKIIYVVKNSKTVKKSKIYFILCKEAQSVKIGVTNDVKKRFDSLQTANPFQLELLKFIYGSRKLEQEIHKQFEHLRINGEWFSYCEELSKFIQNLNSK